MSSVLSWLLIVSGGATLLFLLASTTGDVVAVGGALVGAALGLAGIHRLQFPPERK